MLLDNHDKWLDFEPHTTCWVARNSEQTDAISCTQKGMWLFGNVWSSKDIAIKSLNADGQGPDDYKLAEVSLSELLTVYRAINYDNVLMTVIGISTGIQLSTTYVPTNRLVTDPALIWLYAKDKKGDYLLHENALIVGLTPLTLLAELSDIYPTFDIDLVEGKYTLHANPFADLVSKVDAFYTTFEVWQIKTEMIFSRTFREMKEQYNDKGE